MHLQIDIQPRIVLRTIGRPAGRMPAARDQKLLEEAVAEAFDVDAERLRDPTRGSVRVALARQVAMYLGHVVCGMSLTDVGGLFRRDRTTVAHACCVVEERRDEPAFDRAVELLERITRILCWGSETACRKPS